MADEQQHLAKVAIRHRRLRPGFDGYAVAVDDGRRKQLWQAALASARNDGSTPTLTDPDERAYFERMRGEMAADPERGWRFDDAPPG